MVIIDCHNSIMYDFLLMEQQRFSNDNSVESVSNAVRCPSVSTHSLRQRLITLAHNKLNLQ